MYSSVEIPTKAAIDVIDKIKIYIPKIVNAIFKA
tara:strand:+ start:8369 stop:8470 length:102 start_codon:yes stop_codon:yes gene_type:complete